MIYYNPLDGLPYTHALRTYPRHCFLMTKLGGPTHPFVSKVRQQVSLVAKARAFDVIDAESEVTGKDFLHKIWGLIAATPVSICICHEDFSTNTLSNIFYELGMAQSMGKETVVIKSPGFGMPSDFVRTEWIEYGKGFRNQLGKFFDNVDRIPDSYETFSQELDKDPVLALDYLRRAFLISGSESVRQRARAYLHDPSIADRARNSVENLALESLGVSSRER